MNAIPSTAAWIPDRTGSTMSHPVTMVRRKDGSWSHMVMKSPEVSMRFAFCSSVSLCGTNREQIFRLHKSSRAMLCTVPLLMPNSSAINHKVTRRSCASICRTRSIMSGVLLVDGRPERGSSSVVSFPSRKRLNRRKHIFCSRLPSRTLAPTFHASPSPFSLICSRT